MRLIFYVVVYCLICTGCDFNQKKSMKENTPDPKNITLYASIPWGEKGFVENMEPFPQTSMSFALDSLRNDSAAFRQRSGIEFRLNPYNYRMLLHSASQGALIEISEDGNIGNKILTDNIVGERVVDFYPNDQGALLLLEDGQGRYEIKKIGQNGAVEDSIILKPDETSTPEKLLHDGNNWYVFYKGDRRTALVSLTKDLKSQEVILHKNLKLDNLWVNSEGKFYYLRLSQTGDNHVLVEYLPAKETENELTSFETMDGFAAFMNNETKLYGYSGYDFFELGKAHEQEISIQNIFYDKSRDGFVFYSYDPTSAKGIISIQKKNKVSELEINFKESAFEGSESWNWILSHIEGEDFYFYGKSTRQSPMAIKWDNDQQTFSIVTDLSYMEKNAYRLLPPGYWQMDGEGNLFLLIPSPHGVQVLKWVKPLG